MKHTKGEWGVSKEPFSLLVTHGVNGQKESICQISQRYKSEEEQSANARLIAAAPDLLEALESAYKCSGEHNYLTKPVLDKVLFAIKKAKGE